MANGRLDALIILNRRQRDHPPDRLLVNEGDGRLAASDLWPEGGFAQAVALADLNSNGSLDAFLANGRSGRNAIWINDGQSNFSDSGRRLGQTESMAVALGDVTGDGRIDVFVGGVDSYQVWRGQRDGGFMADPQSNYR